MKKKTFVIGLLTLIFFNLFNSNVLAQTLDPEAIQAALDNAQESADTAYMLICTALVLLMTPGLAFFYGGFVSRKNILNTLMMSFLLMGIVGVTWLLWGYSLAFAPGNPIIGGLEWSLLNFKLNFNDLFLSTKDYLPHFPYEDALKAADPEYADLTSYAPTIPHLAFMMYQGMFAIITPALISGAIVERTTFKAYTLFVVLWSTFVYCPLAHMVWAKGGLFGLAGGLGALDFAGGTVVHIVSGVSAFVAAIMIGPRKAYPTRLSAPHNVPFILLGAGLLWFGWFGFNAGSALASGSLATVAFVTTNTGAASGLITWLILEQILRGKPTAVGAASGAVAGLVGITPAAGFVHPLAAIIIGSLTAVCCFFAISFKTKLGIDDALDTYPVHGVGGTVGAILVGIFAMKSINSLGSGLVDGNVKQLLIQIAAILLSYLIAIVGTFIIIKIVDATVGLRLKPEAEMQGLDINEHGEEGYGEEFAGGISQFNAINQD